MPTVHMTTGLPASGKTTCAVNLVRESAGRMRRVNLDDIRAMMDSAYGKAVWTRQHEAGAQQVQEAAVRAALAAGFDVVVDNTHLTPRMPGRLKQVFAEFDDLDFVVHDFTDVTLDECIFRDGGRRPQVGEDVIRKLHGRHQSATKGGWKLTAEWLAERLVPAPYVPRAGLPEAVLCDIDGTLALNVGRGPYDFERCGEDLLNKPVAHAVALHRAAGDRIVLLSGRSEEYRKQTAAWLVKHEVTFDELWMRPAGDTRRDDIVKLELFDAHVRNRFAVRFSLDDRDRVVALWRRLGLPTFQVNYGNF
jgi:predicted kinase